jgi:hypothetical protein
MTKLFTFAAAVFVGLALAPAAHGQDASKPEDDKLVFEDGGFKIVGKVQKPEVVIVIRRENLDKGFQLQLTEDFLHRVVEAVQDPPF